MTDMNTYAEIEANRLKNARAWSVITKAQRRRLNAYATRYVFPDGSNLTVYTDGSIKLDNTHRVHNWHHCNRQGRRP
jgi:hypothetical protein